MPHWLKMVLAAACASAILVASGCESKPAPPPKSTDGAGGAVAEPHAPPPSPAPAASTKPAAEPRSPEPPDGAAAAAKPDPHDSHAEPGHHHKAPHGGTLVGLGDELAHLEFVLDPDPGRLTLYILDGHAENGVRVRDEAIELVIQPNGPDDDEGAIALALRGVASALTGETVGDTSQFAAESPALKTLKSFAVRLPQLTIKGQEFADVRFLFPEGRPCEHD